MAGDSDTDITGHDRGSSLRPPPPALALAVVWSRSEPERIGEVVLPPAEGADAVRFLGRSERDGGLVLARQRPGRNVETGPLTATGISRQQWRIRAGRSLLGVENVGRRELMHNGVVTGRTQARAGDLLAMRGELLMLVVSRPAELPGEPLPAELQPRFGEPDAFGIVGESAAAWELRRQLMFAARRDDHVLLTGPSGSGKELAARAIHALSRRSGAGLVARNAATLPDGLIDAELFGNARDYPNSGMPDRPGLIGTADGGTLFLDEIGELSHALQAHLLRVIDGGEYHRLGEARARRANLRVVAATNRDPATLKHDFLARLRLRIRIPGLDRRREDIPLIARHLLRDLARDDSLVARRVFRSAAAAEPTWTLELVSELVTDDYPAQVRDLQHHLWNAIARSNGDGLTSETPDEPAAFDDDDASTGDGGDPSKISEAQVLAALEAAAGSRERAWRALGLRSRHQLLRLMRRFGISPRP